MRDIALEGTYYEMGQRYGTLLDRNGFSPPSASDEKRQFTRECEPYVEEYAPELLEEIEGIADAGGWELELIQSIPLALTIESGCSVVAVSGEQTDHSVPIFGRNYDFYRSFAPFSELFNTAPADGCASVGCSDHWTGRHDGINEAGLAVGHTYVPYHDEEPGIMFGLATRAVLDTFRTVPEAVAFLEDIPHARNTNFLVADRTGEIAIVEAAPERVNTTDPDDFGVVTNHFRSESMRSLEPADADTRDSEARLDNVISWKTNTTSATVEDVQALLADPDDGVCDCVSDESGESMETLWSLTGVLDGPDASLAHGRPDRKPYESIDI